MAKHKHEGFMVFGSLKLNSVRLLALVFFITRATCVAETSPPGVPCQTNRPTPTTNSPLLETEVALLRQENASFWGKGQKVFIARVDKTFGDRFGAINQVGLTLSASRKPGDFLVDRMERNGRNAFVSSIVNGSREVAVNSPIFTWLKYGDQPVIEFFRDSIGGIDEEGISPLDPKSNTARERYWEEIPRGRRMIYGGIRPWRQSPYAYLSYQVPSTSGGGDAVSFNVRSYYRNFKDPEVTFSISAPIKHLFTIDVGSAYYFSDKQDRGPVFTLRKSWRDSDAYIGIAPQNSKVVVGLAFAF